MNMAQTISAVAGTVMLLACLYADVSSQITGVVAPILYVAIIVVGLLARSRWLVVIFATLACAFTIIGFQFYVPTDHDFAPVLNRGLTLFTIVVTALGCYLLLKRQGESDSRLRDLAETDPLTGVANRRALMREAHLRLAEARRYRLPLSVLMIDIDHFKNINDEYGHLFGDRMLREISQICASKLRQSDFLGRYGGEEFLVICPNTPCENAQHLAERLRLAIAEMPVGDQTAKLSPTISVGVVALATITSISDVEQLIGAADEALYRAKSNGRNRVETYTSPQALHLDCSAVA